MSLPAGWAEVEAAVSPQTAEAVPGAGAAAARARLAALEALVQQELERSGQLPMADLPEQDDPSATLVAWDLAFCRRAARTVIE
ncbi:MAG: hypothetical protein B7X39_04900 [Lysobacterales bacterium 14-68-21]|nr:hypothetical protein ABB33_17235 [Stenotrophomonas acidaminiphila]OZB67317.1 MAG: hypothetical protein B7X39_04900 [Xanthomonadales bacterium 14-68-21]